MSPKCKISSVSKVIDFIGRWILVGLVFGRLFNTTARILSRTLKFAQFSNQNWFRHHANPTKDLIAKAFHTAFRSIPNRQRLPKLDALIFIQHWCCLPTFWILRFNFRNSLSLEIHKWGALAFIVLGSWTKNSLCHWLNFFFTCSTAFPSWPPFCSAFPSWPPFCYWCNPVQVASWNVNISALFH